MSIGGLVLNCRRRMSRTRQDTRTGKPPQSRAFVGVKVPTKSKDDKIVEKVTTLEPYDKKILAKFEQELQYLSQVGFAYKIGYASVL